MKLKKLEWQKTIDDDFEAEAFEGMYHLTYEGMGLYRVEWTFGDTHRTVHNTAINKDFFYSDQAAMDAAQLDFERIVCDCYEGDHEKT